MTLRARAAAGELGLHPHLAARRAEAEGDPLQIAVAPDLGALRREHPALVGDLLLADVPEVGAVADDQLDRGVKESVALRCVALPDLGLGALGQDHQGAPLDLLAGTT